MQLPRPTPGQMRGLAVASLVANVTIVVTGGAVRLTGSGLGCPTWPSCTEDSLVPQGALGMHGAIEFGNRMMTFLVAVVVGVTWLAALRLGPARRDIGWLATGLLLGIPAQAVVGGITVLTDLNPWAVNFHFMVSMALVVLAVTLVRRTSEPAGPTRPTVPAAVRGLARGTFGVAFAVLYAGTVVTGSGPHAGDAGVEPNGRDPETVSQIHADLVFLLLGLTIGTLLAFRATGAPVRARRAAAFLLAAELAQGVVGITQYLTDLPRPLVGIHMLGAALIAACATWVLVGTRERIAVATPDPDPDLDLRKEHAWPARSS